MRWIKHRLSLICEFFTESLYIVEYKYDDEWHLRGVYNSYELAHKRWQNHNHHCPYYICRIRKASRYEIW